MELLLNPWPWYVVGPLIGLFVPLMAILGKRLGVSSNLKHLCAIGLPKTNTPYLNYCLKDKHWSLFFFAGLFAGGMVGQLLLSSDPVAMLPSSSSTPWGLALLFAGGLFIGFGTRYAEGCTSGHTIWGLSNLQRASFVASGCFFAGGLLMKLINGFLGGVL